MEIKQYFGQKIREIREAQQITQEELAKALGVTRVQVVNIEGGKCGTTLENVYRLCCLLKCSPAILFPTRVPIERKVEKVEKTVMVKTPEVRIVNKVTFVQKA